MKKLCIIAEDYPSEGKPSFPFVQQLAFCMSNEGFECTIIAPQSLTKCLIRHEKIKKRRSLDINPEGKQITVYRPFIITFANATSKLLNSLIGIDKPYAWTGTGPVYVDNHTVEREVTP